MESKKCEIDPLRRMAEYRNDSVRNRNTSAGDPGTVQDWESRKMLKKAVRGISKNKKWVFISFIFELIVFAILLTAWIQLIQT